MNQPTNASVSGKIHGFTIKSRFKWVEAYPSISKIAEPYGASKQEINEGFQRLVDSENIGHVLRMQSKWVD